MTDPGSVMNKLDALAGELDDCSKALSRVEDALGPIAEEYDAFVEAYEVGLWTAHEEDDAKLPPEAMRLKLARHDMNPELRGRYSRGMRQRKKLEREIQTLKAAVSAQQSLLSALKVEAEAVR